MDHLVYLGHYTGCGETIPTDINIPELNYEWERLFERMHNAEFELEQLQ